MSSNDPEGARSSSPPVATDTANAAAGRSLAYAYMQSDGLAGALHSDVIASVSDSTYLVGRDAYATSSGEVTGSISLSSATLPAGVATFSMAIEGGYTFNNLISNPQNSADLSYSVLIGEVGYGDTVYFDPTTHAGLIDIPLTFSMTVTPGESIYMSFYVKTEVTSVAGLVEVNLLNTLKLTSISLPAGYTYTSDSDGFLSGFTAPVPEPTTAALTGAGLLLLLASLHRSSLKIGSATHRSV